MRLLGSRQRIMILGFPYMDMVFQGLAPGMQNHGDPEFAPR
jgi:hypothetical protein